MELNSLSLHNPLGDVNTWASQYVKVLGLKELTVTTYSDVALDLTILFSINGCDSQSQNHNFKLVAGNWNSFNVRISLPWCRFKLENKSGKNNNTLIMSVLSSKKIDVDDDKKLVENSKSEESIDEHHENDGRFKSPLRNILNRRRKSNSHKQLPVTCKVPEYVPKGSLLIGDWSGLKVVPPPVNISDLQVLTCVNGIVEWCIVNENEKDIDTMDTIKNVSWKFD